jgi:hypothetical protein
MNVIVDIDDLEDRLEVMKSLVDVLKNFSMTKAELEIVLKK